MITFIIGFCAGWFAFVLFLWWVIKSEERWFNAYIREEEKRIKREADQIK